MLCKRRVCIALLIGMAVAMSAINLHLMSLHHQVPANEIFLAHFDTGANADSSKRAVKQNSYKPKSAYTSSCYRPNPKLSLKPNETLPFPVINLGFPKMGTSSLHAFFGCAGYRSMHFRCHKTYACAECLRKQNLQFVRDTNLGKALKDKKVDLMQCGKSDVYSQIDRDDYFPQMSLLEEILAGHPNATYFLTFRTIEKWYHSIAHWPPDVPDEYLLKNRIIAPGLRFRGNLTHYAKWFCNHVTRVRKLMEKYPDATLVEIDIEDNTGTAEYMSDLFDVDDKCWGRANVNFDLHSDLENKKTDVSSEKETDTTKEKDDVKAHGSMPWFIMGKNMIRGKNGVMRSRYDEKDFPPHLLALLRTMNQQYVNGSYIEIDNRTDGDFVPTSNENISLLLSQKALSHEDYCNALLAHEKGHWAHTKQDLFASFMRNNSSFRQLIFPKEKDWMKGFHPWYGFGKCKKEKNMLMYNGLLGHQCGCGVRGFEPSLPEWTQSTSTHPRTLSSLDMSSANGFHPSWTEYYRTSATLRLARKLAYANATLCFAGDSIDYQIYFGMQNNLKRVSQLHSMHFSGSPEIVSILDRLIPVNHTTEPGTMDDWYLTGRRPPDGDGSFVNGTRPPPGGFGSMHSILETKAFFKEINDSGSAKLARIRFYMTYGWSPWNVEFMEDCNIVVMNLGLHYLPSGNHTGKQTRRPLVDDLRATFTYLANYSSAAENRIAIWRSALPQHFDTIDGHFHGWENLPNNHSCVNLRKKDGDAHPSNWQIYNALYDKLFASMCDESRGYQLPQPCAHLEHVCNVDVMSTNYPTIFKYWLDNDCTDRVDREKRRLGNKPNVTGTILRWNIFDLFDNPKWHREDMDCTHHCYIPALYDSAFERLELLVAPLVSRFKIKSL